MAAACVVAGVAVVGASASPPTFEPAKKMCENAGGEFLPFAPSYGCIGGTAISYQGHLIGQRVCENAYGGTYVPRPTGYICQIAP